VSGTIQTLRTWAAISPLARRTPSREPTPSRCAGKMEVTMPTSGVTTEDSASISPKAFMPISSTPNCSSPSKRDSVNGSPRSLLALPIVAVVLPKKPSAAAANSLVEVFPHEPVMPTMRTRSRSSRIIRPASHRALRVLSTSRHGPGGSPSGGCCTTAAQAPFWKAVPTKRCPSVRSPGSAKKRQPGVTSRLSITSRVKFAGRESGWRSESVSGNARAGMIHWAPRRVDRSQSLRDMMATPWRTEPVGIFVSARPRRVHDRQSGA